MKKGRSILEQMIVNNSSNSSNVIKSQSDNDLSGQKAGSIKALSDRLDFISKEAEDAVILKKMLKEGNQIVDIDPSKIKPSSVKDRLSSFEGQEFESLKESIKINGQQIPILVRACKENDNFYQAAFGHRRIQAAKELGINVKAIVRDLSDEDLVIAQGQENSSRLDLSFIEKALFASRLENANFTRDTISIALSSDKSEISRYITIVESIGIELIVSIGAAPKIGRRRWNDLSKFLISDKDHTELNSVVKSDFFLSLDSDNRFHFVLDFVSKPKTNKAKTINRSFEIDGKKSVYFEAGEKQSKIIIYSKEFSHFLESKLCNLIEEFKSTNRE